MAKGEAGQEWRKRPSVVLWVLSLGQLISWGLVYYTFPLFVVPMEKELGWSRNAHLWRPVGRPAGRRPVLHPGRRLDRSRPRPHADDRRLAACGGTFAAWWARSIRCRCSTSCGSGSASARR